MSIKKVTQLDKTVWKHNFVDFIRDLVPEIYLDEEMNISGVENDLLYDVVEELVQLVGDLSSILYLSGHTDLASAKSLFNADAIHASIPPEKVFLLFRDNDNVDFNRFSDFTTADMIKTYKYASIAQANERLGEVTQQTMLVDTALSTFTTNTPDHTFLSSIESSISSVATAHEFMLNNYGWLYALNTNWPYDDFTSYNTPKAILARKITETTFKGKPFTIANGVSALIEHIWTSDIL